MYDIECLRDFQILLRWTIFSCSSHMIIFVDFFFLNYTKEEWIFVWGSNPNPGKNVYFIEMPHFFVLARIFFSPVVSVTIIFFIIIIISWYIVLGMVILRDLLMHEGVILMLIM